MKEKAIASLRLKLTRKSSLKSKKQIDLLFKEGYAHKAYPLLVKYSLNTALSNNQLLFTVPKRKFKRAVDRNLIKRRIREAYRIHQHVFSSKVGNRYLIIAFIYVGKEIVSYKVIEKSMLATLHFLANQYDEQEKH